MAEHTSSRKEACGEDRNRVPAYPVFDPGQFADVGRRNAAFLTRAARACLSGAAQMNKEFIAFVDQRVRKDLEAAKILMVSKSPDDAWAAQAEFVEGTIRDYADEASKFFDLASRLAKDVLSQDDGEIRRNDGLRVKRPQD